MNQTKNGRPDTIRNRPGNRTTINNFLLSEEITMDETICAINKANIGKASGNDNIPVDVLTNRNCAQVLHKLFSTFFITGKVPEMWSYIIINPIPKNNLADPRDPLC